MRKVLIIDLHCDALLPAGVGEFGGGNNYSKSLISSIMNTNIEFMYITRKKISSLSDTEKVASNIKYIRIQISQQEVEDKDTLFLYADEILNKIFRLLEQYLFTPDLIHSIYWPSGIVAQKLSDFFNVPMIHTVLSNGKRKKIQSGNYAISNDRISAEQSCFNQSEYIICSSNYELNDIKDLYHIPENKLILTGLDVDKAFKIPAYDNAGSYQLSKLNPETFQYITIDHSSHYEDSLWWNNGAFLYYGRLHPDKGIFEIIACWLELKQKYTDFPPLWIAGGTPEQIHKLRKRTGCEELLSHYEQRFDLIWWGRLTPEGLSTLMLKTLALVSHSRYESGGLMILEAMSHKTPVIATPHGYAKDYIHDWENGFLVPYNDKTQLKRRLIHFYKQPFLSSVLGEKAGCLYKNIETIFNFSEKHMALYRTGKALPVNKHFNSDQPEIVLPYPITESVPSDSEILSYFTHFIHELSCNYDLLPILRKSNDALQYHQWIIEWDQQLYECFMWKSFINRDKAFFDAQQSFYISDKLFENDKTLYENGCSKPLNTPTKMQISIYRVDNYRISWKDIHQNFLKLFSIPKDCFNNIPCADFKQLADESKKALIDYCYFNDDYFENIYEYLNNVQLQDENKGIIPLFLMENTIIDNQFRHTGFLGYGTKSCFYAQYILHNEIQDIEKFVLDERLYKNTLYWILNFLFHNAVRDLIKFNIISDNTKRDIQNIMNLLK